jgi:hypothetical protein
MSGLVPMGLDVALVSLTADDIARLYRSEARRMAGFLVARTHDPEVALDLVAETFASVVRDRRQFRGEGDEAATAWVYGIARNLLSNWYRRGEVERRAMRRLGVERPVIGEAEYERLIELAGLAQMRTRLAASCGAYLTSSGWRSRCGSLASVLTRRFRGRWASASRPRALVCRAACARWRQ